MARDWQREFKDKCLTCKKYDIYCKGDATVRGFRCKRLMRQMALDEHCYQYDFDATRSNWTIEEAVNWLLKRGYDPRPDCYITTAICEIMGLPLNCEYVQNFRVLRDTFVTALPNGKEQITSYDVYGSQIANKMLEEYKNVETREKTITTVQKVLFPTYLVVVNNLINAGELEAAWYTYGKMISMLSEKYQITYYVPPKEEDIQTFQEENCNRKLAITGA